MKLKRIQVVTLSNGRKLLTVSGSGPMAVSDLCYERGQQLFNNALHRRMLKNRFYDLTKQMDVMACIVSAFMYGRDSSEAGVGYSIKPSRQDMVAVRQLLAESNDLTDPVMTLECKWMERYRRLFTHLYGKQLSEQGVNVDD